MEAIQTTPPLAELKPISEKGSKLKDLPSVKVKATIEVEVPGGWLSMCTMWPDIMSTDYIGYWARGVKRDDKLGWLIWEFEEDKRLEEFLEMHSLGDDTEDTELHAEAMKAWKAGEKLPPLYHALNREAAVKGFLAMLEWPAGRAVEGGINWYENGDANSYDVAVQLAVLGEVKYG